VAKALIGKKIGMTQVFNETGELIPVTVLETGPCVVTVVKTIAHDGYEALQLGYGEVKRINRPDKGQFAAAGVEPRRVLAEVRTAKASEFKVGQTLTADIFSVGEKALVSAVSKGKGFAGVIKRWGFKGGPGGHGSHFHRAPGSVGMCATPSRVLKGKKLPGRYGGKRVTALNLDIVKVDAQQNILLVKGSVPGAQGGLVLVRAAD